MQYAMFDVLCFFFVFALWPSQAKVQTIIPQINRMLYIIDHTALYFLSVWKRCLQISTLISTVSIPFCAKTSSKRAMLVKMSPKLHGRTKMTTSKIKNENITQRCSFFSRLATQNQKNRYHGLSQFTSSSRFEFTRQSVRASFTQGYHISGFLLRSQDFQASQEFRIWQLDFGNLRTFRIFYKIEQIFDFLFIRYKNKLIIFLS